MWQYNYSNELYHYGVKGMKWGVRRARHPEISTAKRVYKDAKKDLRRAVRNERRSGLTAVGVNRLQKYGEMQNKRRDAEIKALDAKVAYKVSKAKNEKQAAKAEFKAYKKAMNGVRNSAADTMSDGKSTRVYNHVMAKKGKEYADKVEKRIQNEAIATIAGSAAFMVGQAYLNSRGYR